MHRPVFRWTALPAIAVGMTLLGTGWAGFRTEVGRDVFTRFGVAALSDVLHGSATVDSIGGSVYNGLELFNLVVHDDDGVLFARIPRLAIRYRLLDLLSRRVVLGQVVLEDPQINLYQKPNGRFNHEDVLGLGGEGNGGPSPLVSFRDARISGGSVTIRTPTGPPEAGDTWEVEGDSSSLVRVRRIEGIEALVRYVRLVSPFPGEDGLEFDVGHLAARISDPELDIRSMSGRINIVGRTMALALTRLELPGSVATLEGELSWPRGVPLFDLQARARTLAINDLRTFADRLPWNMTGHGELRLWSVADDSLVLEADPLFLEGPDRGGTVRGNLRMMIAQDGLAAIQDADLTTDNLDLELVRPLVDTLPFAGRLTGRFAGRGPVEHLDARLAWWFRDSLVTGWPETEIFGRGGIALGEEGLAFLDFAVDSADVDLATVQNMFPAVELRGHLGGFGALRGPLHDITYTGLLWHRDGQLPISRARGTVRLNSERDTIGVWADLAFDSLDMSGLRPSYPTLPPAGVFGGRGRITGYADSLRMDLDLEGAPGRIEIISDVVLLPGLLALHGMEASLTALDLRMLDTGFVSTELYGRLSGEVVRDSAAPFYTDIRLAFDSSIIVGSAIDSIGGAIRVADSTFHADSVWAWSPSLSAELGGSFGLTDTRRGDLLITLDIDSLSWAESVLGEMLPTLDGMRVFQNLNGFATGQIGLHGSIGSYGTELVAQIDEAVSDSALLLGLTLEAAWHTERAEQARVGLEVDSLWWKNQSYSDVVLHMQGPMSRSTWMARARIGMDASLIGWGESFVDDQNIILPMDSMRVLLPTHIWDLSRGALIAVSDSGYVFSNFTLQSLDGGSQLELTGRFPTNGSAALNGSFVAIPVADVFAMIQRDPEMVAGLMFGDFALGGTAEAPELTSTLNLTQAQLGAVHIPELRGTLTYSSRRLVGDYEVRRSGDVIMGITFDFPLDLALHSVPDRQLPGPLSVRARADGIDLAFAELFTQNIRQTSGTLDADVGVTGTWNAPELTGSIEIHDGSSFIIPIGITHHRINGRVVLDGDSILVDRLSVGAGAGQLDVEGFVRLQNLTQPVLELRLIGSEFETIDVPQFMSLTMTGDVRLRGPVFGSTLTGRASVTRGVVYFTDFVEKRIVNLEEALTSGLVDETFFASAGLRREEGLRLVRTDFENRFLDSLRIDSMRVEMGTNVLLRSSESNIQLAGELSVSKRREVYRLDGTLNTPRGTYRLPLTGRGVDYGPVRDFTVTDGTVSYFGTTDWNAQLDITARHVVRSLRRNDVTVFVHIGGTLFTPVLSLSSDIQPPISDTEIISYLLFGAPTVEALGNGRAGGGAGGRISNENLLLAEATSILAGPVSGYVERLFISELGIPIDYFQFSVPALNIYNLTVGRQIGRNVFFSFSQRLCPGEALNLSASLETRLSRSWLVSLNMEPVTPCGLYNSRFSTQDNFQFGTDFFWEKRY